MKFLCFEISRIRKKPATTEPASDPEKLKALESSPATSTMASTEAVKPSTEGPAAVQSAAGQASAATTTVAEPPKDLDLTPEAPKQDPTKLYLQLSHPVDFTKPFDKAPIKGQSVLVTGGAQGLGEDFVRNLAAAGAYCTIADWSEEPGQKLEAELKAAGVHVQFVKTDVSDWDSLRNSFDKAIEFSPTKTLESVIANAGIAAWEVVYPFRPGMEMEPLDKPLEKLTTKTLDVNLVGVLWTVKMALHYFRFQGDVEKAPKVKKSIVLVSSMGGYTEMQGATLYNCSKFAVRGIFKSLRNAIPNSDYRINLIAPNFILTNMTSRAAEWIAKSGQGFAKKEDASDAIMRFTADQSINGRAIAVLPSGNVDLRDDITGHDAGDQVLEWFKENKWA